MGFQMTSRQVNEAKERKGHAAVRADVGGAGLRWRDWAVEAGDHTGTSDSASRFMSAIATSLESWKRTGEIS